MILRLVGVAGIIGAAYLFAKNAYLKNSAGENVNLLDTAKDYVMKTRGERNNNPGNIRLSASNWLGKIVGTDKSFETFSTPENGIRAVARLLKNYAAGGHNTIAKIIKKYAPPNENNTAAYIASVVNYTGFGANDVLDLSNVSTLAALTEAIINHENGGVRYTTAQILDGVSRA